MKFRCFPKGAEVPPTSTSARKTAARPAALDLRAAGTTRGGRSDHLKAGPVADIDCDDEVEEEIARAFAEGLKMDHPAAGSPPSSPVSDPATAAGGRDALAARTVIILDWDDTILTTTRLTSRYSVFGINATKPLPTTLQRELCALEKDAIRLLEVCQERGRTVIVTNAAKGWVQQSGRRFIPRVVDAIGASGIQVVSAQAAFAHTCPSGDPAEWKKKAFLRELTGKNINLVSVGDSIFEREAAHFASKQSHVETTKTVKFIDSPSIEQLRRQIVTVTEKIPMICEVGRSFDVDMEL